jgi:hypothetical protein
MRIISAADKLIDVCEQLKARVFEMQTAQLNVADAISADVLES